MVRNYIRKTDRGLKYTREALREAVEKVKSGLCNEYNASRRYNIPRSTLSDHVKGKYGMKSKGMGCPPAIGESDETTIAENLRFLQTNGFNLGQKKILELVSHHIKTNNIKNSLKNGTPGHWWWLSFSKRHRLLTKPLYIEFGRQKEKEVIMVKEFYSILESRSKELDLVNKPGHVWHIEEHSFFNGKSVANTDEPKDITVVSACNAEGKKAPLLTVFKGEESQDWMLGKHINISHNLGMCRDVFKNYFSTIFLNYIDDTHPNIIIYDGQSAHIDFKIVEDAIKAKITMIKSPEFIKDLGLSVMGVLKDRWSKVNENDSKQFSGAIAGVFDDLEILEIEEGFKNAGVYPFEAVCDSKFDNDRLRVYEEYEACKAKFTADQETVTSDAPEKVMIKEDLEFQRALKIEPEDSISNSDIEIEFSFMTADNDVPSSSSRQLKDAMVAVENNFVTSEASSSKPGLRVDIEIDVPNAIEPHKLTEANENRLVTWVKDITNAGFILNEETLTDAVRNIATDKAQTVCEDFLKTHQELTDRISKDLPTIGLDDNSVRICLDRVKMHIKNINLEDVLNDPRRIFYCEEIKFHQTNKKEVSVLATASADGNIQTSVLFNFVEVSNRLSRVEAWTKMEVFADYITEVFYPWLRAKNVPRPVIVFMDHATQINLAVSEFCKCNKIVLIGSPKIRPFESLYSILNGYWKENRAKLGKIKKDDLGKELEMCIKKIPCRDIVNGFKSFELYRFDLRT